jgi:starch synthase
VLVWRGEVEEVPVVFLQPDTGHFDVGCIYGRGDDHVRFGFFSECALAWLEYSGDRPDVLHAHDWSTAPVVFARRSQLPPNAATAVTIHNLNFGQDLIGRAMRACTFATTVGWVGGVAGNTHVETGSENFEPWCFRVLGMGFRAQPLGLRV